MRPAVALARMLGHGEAAVGWKPALQGEGPSIGLECTHSFKPMNPESMSPTRPATTLLLVATDWPPIGKSTNR